MEEGLMASARDLTSMDYIYKEWSFPFDEKKDSNGRLPYLDETAGLLVQRMEQLEARRDMTQIWDCYDELLRQTRKTKKPTELARVEVICARYDLKFGRASQAQERLIDAIDRNLSDDHFVAVARWLLGIVCWSAIDTPWDAISEWDACKKIFADLADNSSLGRTKNDWYKERNKEINSFMENIQGLLGLPSVRPAIHAAPSAPAARRKSAPAPSYLRLYPVLSSTSAGTWSPRVAREIGWIEATEIQVDGELYSVVSLLEGNVIKSLTSDKLYSILVEGESMNEFRPPILSGDYVLIDPDRKAVNGNAVFVELVDKTIPDEKDTLKRYKEEGVYDVFEPVSNRPQFEGIEFRFKKSDRDNKYRILGVAVARLTPKPETS
jgi:SOS-response transcriptional repressor LexA